MGIWLCIDGIVVWMLNEERLGRRSDGGAGKGLVEWLTLFVEAFDDLPQ